ncbi:uncharacterized protein LOC107884821 isoform X3 [Acyrthosiphon pisum]|uniref:Uncharacterized protein n=1 Tax=Acyrthosiphon pisum TaxID=7029 RepID=A0A8R2JWQ4_ACYPI|nr:uncharacterized protein LOC107884821 isoform X3 [Acyrthosiphon pisum]
MYTNAVKSYNLGLERKEDRDKLLREWDDLGNKEDKKTLKRKYYENMLSNINKKKDCKYSYAK